MSQITRCPVCQTMFKVVADQFEAAQGWVRCGHCSEVFDAAQHLVLLDPAAPPGADAAASVAPVVLVAPAISEAALEALPASAELQASDTLDGLDGLPVSSSQPEDVTPALTDDPLDSAPMTPEAARQDQPAQDDKPEPEPLAPAGAEALPAASQDEASDAATASLMSPVELQTEAQADAAAEAQTEAVAEAAAVHSGPDSGALDPVATLVPPAEADVEAVETNPDIIPSAILRSAEPAPEPEPEVSFVRDARRKAFWKRPLVRVLLGLVFLLLLTALLLQWVLQQKDNLAATDPRLVPFLQRLCGPLNCEIRPPRHIESLLIDSSSFRKTGPDVYLLSFVLKNTSAIALEMPSLEVTLTDIEQQALVRRVLAPREFGATTASLAGHGELAGVVTLKVAAEPVPGAPLALPLPVSGYRVVAFYP